MAVLTFYHPSVIKLFVTDAHVVMGDSKNLNQMLYQWTDISKGQ